MKRSIISAVVAAVVVPLGVTAALLGSSPAEAAVGGSGPYPADYETQGSLPNHTIYRPQTLPSVRMPIFVWGNGGCSGNGLDQQNYLREIASHGFLAVANGAPGGSGSTNSAMMTQTMDWAVSENNRQGSKYYQKLDTSKIMVAGWSCGGLEAYDVSNDPRVTTTGIMNSGLLSDGDDYKLRRLTKPIVYLLGGPSDIAYPNGTDDYGKLPSGLPAFMGNLNVGHGATYGQTNGGEFGRVTVLWAKWQLKGDTTAGAAFAGSGCALCSNGWTVQRKNLTLGTTPPSSPPPSSPTNNPPSSTPPSNPPSTPPTSSQPGNGCSTAYKVSNQWNGGFVSEVTVTAGGSAINGWRVSLSVPGGTSVTQVWNAVGSGTSGTVTATNQSYNGRLNAGQSTTFGFQGTGTGSGITATCSAS